MNASILITICALLLLAYIFDITSSKTKIPSVILLLLLGWTVNKITQVFNINVPNLESVLPIIGTIGLILIVLEGSLELEIRKENLSLINKSAFIAFIPILLLSFIIAQVIYYFDADISFKHSLTNAIPLSIISSAVAISSVKHLAKSQKEFVVYESSLSDVFGVIFFNFVTLREIIDSRSIGVFALDIFFILIISALASVALAFLLNKIKHKVKFGPIIILVILIYVISKIYHLPALIFILLFGLFIGNLDELIRFNFIKKINPEILNTEIQKFRELTAEFTFLIRTLFFILFGFLIDTKDVLNPKTFPWALGIVILVFIIRLILLKMFKIDKNPLVFISPRGLITILLFLSIPSNMKSELVNNSLVIQVIILSAFVMMFGLMLFKNKQTNLKS